MARKEKETSMPALPGMAMFSLSTPSSPECTAAESHPALDSPWTKSKTHPPGPNDDAPRGSHAPADLWDYENTALHSMSLDLTLQQSSHRLFETNTAVYPEEPSHSDSQDGATASMKTGGTFDFGDFLLSPPETILTDLDMDIEMLAVDKPDPVADLTALLSKMSPYEHQLSKLSGGEFDNYPIGDALFLSQRFYNTLSDYGRISRLDSSSHLDIPTMLLRLSCYMTLTRIYSSIFGYLHDHLSQLRDLRPAHSAHDASRLAHPFKADVQAFRGLRFSQLRPICLCASWDPAKKAISMLLGSLADAEGVLGLPLDVRVVTPLRAEGYGEGPMSPKENAGEIPVLLEEGLMVALTNGRLYKTVKEQASELRGKVKQVGDLLEGIARSKVR
ncbi:hypothetical protein BP6252_11337 [Coleophoma cylindrospora]|uniref:Uncharacterized protein n=1 Tax=Coleophoma cylindrospora TaxID=1849047 RepID=A0A3D8QPS4_9HELO|nr:hypothetical protein BP6252_11337 [Coleophoma cylindrospora]